MYGEFPVLGPKQGRRMARMRKPRKKGGPEGWCTEREEEMTPVQLEKGLQEQDHAGPL